MAPTKGTDRFGDDGLEQAAETFELGEDVSQDEIAETLAEIEEMVDEEED